jgi:glycosyltransferase involved in cell wall biosynthesis
MTIARHVERLPHFVAPSPNSAHVAIAYKNFAANKGISHIGLGVTALTNAKILNAAGIWTEVWPINSADDLRTRLAAAQRSTPATPVSDVIVSAPWLPTQQLAAIATLFHQVNFTVNSHSNVGFLQADPRGLMLLREAADLQTGTINVHIGANSRKFISWWHEVYQEPMRWLPNMYAISTAQFTAQAFQRGGPLRIGSFGAVRPLKNLLTAGAAALEIASRVQFDLEFNISSGRAEGGGVTILDGLAAMFAGLPNARIIYNNWASWPAFLRTVRNMDLLLMPSYTESFSMVTGDAIGQGVPVVGSDAIDWLPRRWIASNDDANDIADVGTGLLYTPNAIQKGVAALQRHNDAGLQSWSGVVLGAGQ